MMRCVYFGGCWMTNMGNAFIDLGSLELARPYGVSFYSELSPFLFGCPPSENRRNYLNTFMDHKPSCAIFSGMVTCSDFITDQALHFELFDKYKIPVVFNGVGGASYSNKEVTMFREFIKSHKFAGFISRDDRSFEHYHDLFKLSFKGTDCAFFLPDRQEFSHLALLPKKYTVFSVDNSDAKKINWKDYEEYREAEADGSDVYCYNQTLSGVWGMNPDVEKWKKTPKTLMAEIPDEYIYVYAQSKCTFTTRVHSCIATLAFGGKAFQLFDRTPRNSIFDSIGCSDVVNRPTKVNMDTLEARKEQHRQGFKTIMENLK